MKVYGKSVRKRRLDRRILKNMPPNIPCFINSLLMTPPGFATPPQ